MNAAEEDGSEREVPFHDTGHKDREPETGGNEKKEKLKRKQDAEQDNGSYRQGIAQEHHGGGEQNEKQAFEPAKRLLAARVRS